MRMRQKISMLFWIMFSAATCSAAEFDSGSLADKIHIHGFASQGYLQSDQNNYYADTEEGSFEFNEFGVNVGADMTEKLRVAIQFLSRDLGEVGNNTIELDWAYGQYRWRDWLGLQIGRIQVPLGLYNETRDLDFLRTWIFLPPSLYEEQHRDVYDAMLGVGILGNTETTPLGSVAYTLGYGQKTLDETSSTFSNEDRLLFNDMKLQINDIFGSDITWDTPHENLRFNGSFGTYRVNFQGKRANHPFWIEQEADIGSIYSSTTDGKYAIVSAEYTTDSLTVAAEYERVTEENKYGDHNTSEGYYASVAYWLTDWLECGAYYSVSYPDRDDTSGKRFQERGLPDYLAWQKELVLTSRFTLNEWWLLKVEGHIINGVADFNIDDNPDSLEEHSFLFAVKTTFSF